MNNNIGEFISEIIKQAGLDKMPKDFLADYKEKLAIEAQKRLGLAAMETLPDDKIEEFSKIAEATPDDYTKINKYLTDNIPDFEIKMTKALQTFGEEMIANAKK